MGDFFLYIQWLCNNQFRFQFSVIIIVIVINLLTPNNITNSYIIFWAYMNDIIKEWCPSWRPLMAHTLDDPIFASWSLDLGWMASGGNLFIG